MKRLAGISFFLFVMCFFWACDNGADTTLDRYDSGVLHISCDESFKPAIDAQVQVYEARYPKTKIIAHYKPEAECLKDFKVDSIRMIITTREFSEAEKAFVIDSLKLGPEAFTVAYDAIAVIVNPQATDSFFTLSDLKNILTGKANKNLIPVFDGLKATSTVRFMLDSVLQGPALGKNVVAAESSTGVIEYVAKTPNAIGFLGISWIGNKDDTLQLSYLNKVRLARLESTDSVGGFVLPVQYLIYSRTYPLIRNLVYVLKEKHTGLAHAFASFMRSDQGQLLFRRSYLYPAVRPFYIRETELQ